MEYCKSCGKPLSFTRGNMCSCGTDNVLVKPFNIDTACLHILAVAMVDNVVVTYYIYCGKIYYKEELFYMCEKGESYERN